MKQWHANAVAPALVAEVVALGCERSGVATAVEDGRRHRDQQALSLNLAHLYVAGQRDEMQGRVDRVASSLWCRGQQALNLNLAHLYVTVRIPVEHQLLLDRDRKRGQCACVVPPIQAPNVLEERQLLAVQEENAPEGARGGGGGVSWTIVSCHALCDHAQQAVHSVTGRDGFEVCLNPAELGFGVRTAECVVDLFNQQLLPTNNRRCVIYCCCSPMAESPRQRRARSDRMAE